MSDKRVLVTGAAGYVGRLVVAALAKHDDVAAVVALDVAPTPDAERAAGVSYVEMSVCDDGLSALVKEHAIDTIVHLASVLRPPKDAGDDLAYRVDVLGTRNVLDAALAGGVQKLVVTSSGAAYGYHADNPNWLDEEDPVRGNAEFAYSHHKRLIEEMLAEARAQHPELKQLIFRPGTVLGHTVNSPVTDLFERPVMLGILGSPSPFVFIWDEDVVECIIRGVLGDQTGIYNLAGDGALTPREIARVLHKPFVPVPAAVLGAALGLLRRLGKSSYGPEQVKFLQYRPVLSNARLKHEFGYEPKLTSRQAFERFVQGRRHAS
ncbi:MAG: SDR family oxidoreductase [Polyangiaceae bacterium]